MELLNVQPDVQKKWWSLGGYAVHNAVVQDPGFIDSQPFAGDFLKAMDGVQDFWQEPAYAELLLPGPNMDQWTDFPRWTLLLSPVVIRSALLAFFPITALAIMWRRRAAPGHESPRATSGAGWVLRIAMNVLLISPSPPLYPSS